MDEIVAFVQGRTSLPDFVRRTHENRALEAVLEKDATIRPYTDAGNLMNYLLQQDWSSLAAQVSIQDALSQFLHAKGRPHVVDTFRLQLYEAVLANTPAWLYLPEFFVDRIAEIATSLPARKALGAIIKNQIAASFRYLKKPPKWLQSPSWLCVDNRPLLFVGQMDLGDLMHDKAQAYLFFDTMRAEARMLIQVA